MNEHKEIIIAVGILIAVIGFIFLMVHVQMTAPCEDFGGYVVKDMPVRCLDYWTGGGK